MNQIHRIASELRSAGIESAPHEAHLILNHCLEKEGMNPIKEKINHLVRQRLTRYPLQYLLGEGGFFESVLKVQEGVFIPRPETEILVETALNILHRDFPPPHRASLLDVGTGSGNIAISIKRKRPDCPILALDSSPKALSLAKKNAGLYGLDRTLKFRHSCLFSTFADEHRQFDMILSNPPYLSEEDLTQLQPEVSYEPLLALKGGKDGLNIIFQLIEESPHYLRPGGHLLIEIGQGQEIPIRTFIKKKTDYADLSFIPDLNEIQRILVLKKNG